MNKKIKNKIIPIALSCSIVATSLCGCTSNKDNSKNNMNSGKEEVEIYDDNISDKITFEIPLSDILNKNEVETKTEEEPEIKEEIIEPKSNVEIAYEVINGLWGNSDERITRLTQAGYDVHEVQLIVNEIMKELNSCKCEYGYVGFLNRETNVFDNNSNIITTVEEYQKVIIYDDFNNNYENLEKPEFAHICIPNVCDGYVLTENITYLPNTFVEVDISEQKLYMYIDSQLVFEANVITGNPNMGNPTDIGYTEIYDKRYKTVLEKYNSYVDAFFSFNDTEGFHDADGWRSDSEYGNNEYYKINGSHGCINMKQSDIDTLDELVSVGTKVLVHE